MFIQIYNTQNVRWLGPQAREAPAPTNPLPQLHGTRLFRITGVVGHRPKPTAAGSSESPEQAQVRQ